jgi:hypothetical protein
MPFLSSEVKGAPHERLFWRLGGDRRWAVRDGDWKLVRSEDKPDEPYNLAADIGKNTDLVGTKPEVAKRLGAALDGWNKELVIPAFPGSTVKNEDWGGGRQQPGRSPTTAKTEQRGHPEVKGEWRIPAVGY